jgi:hypothetical protein
MKTPNLLPRKENGQVMVIMAVIVLVLIFMTALLIDGGLMMLNKRQAQNAADAGALAGARVICGYPGFGPSNQAGIDAVNNAADTYVNNNKALPGPHTYTGGNEITVNAHVKNKTFFARIFTPDAPPDSSATATAACLIPSNGALPVAFYCPNALDNCDVDIYDCKSNSTCTPDTTLYIMVDGSGMSATDPWSYCMGSALPPPSKETGKMICDINNKGVKINVMGNGQRAFVIGLCDPPNSLTKCMNGIFNNSGGAMLQLGPTDVTPGTEETFYNILQNKIPPPYYFLLPYYDAPNDPNPKKVNIAGAVTFMVTCVNTKTGNQDNTCVDGGNIWLTRNKDAYKDSKTPGNFSGARTLEGYFVKNYPIPNTGSLDAPNLGTFYISLIH